MSVDAPAHARSELDPASHLDELDDEQREAVLAPRGPVCVLAGAGTGKTRTITRRIAHLVTAGHVAASQVLAVTFTQRAAGEMRSRLRALDDGCRHRLGAGDDVSRRGTPPAAVLLAAGGRRHRLAAAGQQVLRRRPGRQPGRAAGQHRRRARPRRRDRMGQGVADQPGGLCRPPSPRSAATSRSTRRRSPPSTRATKRSRPARDGTALLDFDDLLLHTAAAIENDAAVAEEFRDRYRCFVVDEYQDVTPLQQRVLDAWLGERDDLTVVGDANQTIYSFTGATPQLPAGLLAALPRRRRGAAGTRLPVDAAGGVAGQPGDRRRPRPGGGQQAAPDRPARPGPGAVVRRAPRRGRRGGGAVRPESVELWSEAEDRIHERRLFARSRDGWDVTLLAP